MKQVYCIQNGAHFGVTKVKTMCFKMFVDKEVLVIDRF